jgi:photosystem II stability/assembly factor-like uncharacterized protein
VITRRLAITATALLAFSCRGGTDPEPDPELSAVRLTIATPSASTAIVVGQSPNCTRLPERLTIPVGAQVTLSAVALDAEGESDVAGNTAARFRLSGGGSSDPTPQPVAITFTRTGAFTGTLRANAALTDGNVTVAISRSGTRDHVWGPCAIPVTAQAAEEAPPGSGWQALTNSPTATGSHFQDAAFVSPQRGFVIGGPGDVYSTTDAGATWQPRFNALGNTGAMFFRSTAFIDQTRGSIGDLNAFNNPQPQRALWETTDGGATWTNISSRITGPPAVGICGMWAIDQSTIFGVGRWSGPAVFIRTTDGGATWQSVSLAPLLTGAVDVYFFDRQRGIIGGGRGVGNTAPEQESSRTVILATDDGGQTWTERFVGTKRGSWSWKISFPAPNVGYVATQGPSSEGVVLKSTDAGRTWSEIQITGAAGFWGIGFVSPLRGWVGADDRVYETRDGGLTWTSAAWAVGESVNRFRVLKDGSAFATGKRVYKYRR